MIRSRAAPLTGPALAVPVTVRLPVSGRVTATTTETVATPSDSEHDLSRAPLAIAIARARSQARPGAAKIQEAAASALRSAALCTRCRITPAAPIWTMIAAATQMSAIMATAQTVADPRSARRAVPVSVIGTPRFRWPTWPKP